MTPDAQKLKAAMRAEIRARIATLTQETRQKASEDLCQHLLESELWQTAKTILLYAPMPDEPDLWPLAEAGLVAGKTIALPRFSDAHSHYAAACLRDLHRDLRVGKYGIREPLEACAPLPLSDLHLVLVPAIAFDRHGHRLGRGRGYYDRLLTETSGAKCGIALDEQVVNELAVEAHDQRVDWIATPTRLIKIPREA